MGLLSDFYNTVARFFRPQEESVDGENSKSVATNRLKLVLMQDRTNLTPKILEQMRGELVDLLSKYLEMDKELLELNFEQEGDQVALMLSIPVIRAKDEEEIEEALRAQAKMSEEDSEEQGDEEDSEEDGEQNDIKAEEEISEEDVSEDGDSEADDSDEEESDSDAENVDTESAEEVVSKTEKTESAKV